MLLSQLRYIANTGIRMNQNTVERSSIIIAKKMHSFVTKRPSCAFCISAPFCSVAFSKFVILVQPCSWTCLTITQWHAITFQPEAQINYEYKPYRQQELSDWITFIKTKNPTVLLVHSA